MTESDEPTMTVEKRLDTMGDDLHGLRVRYEHHDEQIQRIAEVQHEHGNQLGEIKDELVGVKGALEPLPAIHDFVKRIAGEHEARIAALEKGAEGG